MAFRLVSSGGNVVDPAIVNIRCSGIVHTGGVVEFSRTGGAGVYPASSSSTQTNVFGICQQYRVGASDAETRVVKFSSDQLWEADCTDAAITAQIGLNHVLNNDLLVRNTSTDAGAGNLCTAIFRAIAMTGSTSGSGKLIGYFKFTDTPIPPGDTKWS